MHVRCIKPYISVIIFCEVIKNAIRCRLDAFWSSLLCCEPIATFLKDMDNEGSINSTRLKRYAIKRIDSYLNSQEDFPPGRSQCG